MAFIIFEKIQENGKKFYQNLNEHYSLAGWNNGLIYFAWETFGKPINKGYTFTADDLLKQFNENYSIKRIL